jgi:hypothetical protein
MLSPRGHIILYIIYIYMCNQTWINHSTSLTWNNRRYFPMCPDISYDSTIVI